MERNKNLTHLSQNLRKNQTKEENLLWYRFLKHYPVPFRRQYIIGDYIVDFFCHQARLAVELDGSGHYERSQMEKDNIRTKYLETQNLTVLRFTNLDVQKNFYAVCEQIDKTVKERVTRK